MTFCERFRGGRHANCLKLLDGPPRGPVLDVGCAEARFSYGTQGQDGQVRYVGIDVDVEALRNAKRLDQRLGLIAARGEALPFQDGTFGTVVMLDVLEHVGDDLGAVREVARVLSAGGIFIITTPHRGLFSWLDVSNLKLQLPTVYRLFCRLTGAQSHSLRQHLRQVTGHLAGAEVSAILREKKPELRHRHYSVTQLQRLLAGLKVERIRRTGFLLFPVMHILGVFISKAFKTHVRLFMDIAALEDGIEFGSLAYNVSVRAVKTTGVE